MDIDTGREFPYPNSQDDPDIYPMGYYYHDLEDNLIPQHPQVPSSVDSHVAQLEAQVSRLTADLQRAKNYIISLGGSWPPISNSTGFGGLWPKSGNCTSFGGSWPSSGNCTNYPHPFATRSSTHTGPFMFNPGQLSGSDSALL